MEAIPSPPSLIQPSSWDDLRRSVRTLEADVETKLATFQTLTSALLHGKDGDIDEAMVMQRTVEEMTGKLSSNVAHMASLIESGQVENKTTMLHHLQRHRDVLFDFERELRKGKNNLASAAARRQLFENAQAQDNDQDYLLAERNRIDSSLRMADDVLNQAQTTRDDLLNQRNTLLSSERRLGGTTGKFAGINSLLRSIGVKRKQEAFILGGVTSICVVLLLWWMLG